jgi:ribosome modulation factor
MKGFRRGRTHLANDVISLGSRRSFVAGAQMRVGGLRVCPFVATSVQLRSAWLGEYRCSSADDWQPSSSAGSTTGLGSVLSLLGTTTCVGTSCAREVLISSLSFMLTTFGAAESFCSASHVRLRVKFQSYKSLTAPSLLSIKLLLHLTFSTFWALLLVPLLLAFPCLGSFTPLYKMMETSSRFH